MVSLLRRRIRRIDNRIISRGVGNLSTNFGVSGTFGSPLMGQQLSGGPRDLANLTFDLGGYGACQ